MSYENKRDMSHDLTIVTSSGQEVGLMLAEDKDGKKLYERIDDSNLSQQYYTGSPNYAHLPPEKELRCIQDSCEGGFGQEWWDADNPKRYYASYGCDARFRNNVILGPKATPVTIGSSIAPVINNGEFEIYGSGDSYREAVWDGWECVLPPRNIASWMTMSADSSEFFAGGRGRCAGFTLYTITSGMGHVSGTEATLRYQFPNAQALRGMTITVKARVGVNCNWTPANPTAAAGTACLFMYDNVGGINEGSSSGVPPIVIDDELSVTYTVNPAATALYIEVEMWYLGGDGNFLKFAVDNVRVTSPVPPVVTSVTEHNGKMYVAAGSNLLCLNATGDAFDVASQRGAVITDLEAFKDGRLYLAHGTDGYYEYMNADGTFTTSNKTPGVTDKHATFFKNVSGVMYKAMPPNLFSRTLNPANSINAADNWLAVPQIVGGEDDTITALESDIDIPYFGKTDTVYYIDQNDKPYPLISDMQTLRGAKNCKNMVVWHRCLYAPCSDQALAEYNNGAVTFRSPSAFCTNLPDFSGNIDALAYDDEYLYAIVNNGGICEVLAGQIRTVDNYEQWVWHPIQRIPISGCAYACVSTVCGKRLWIFPSDISQSAYYMPLPSKYGGITSDQTMEWQTGGYLITPWYHSDFKSDEKSFFGLTLTTEGCSQGAHIAAYYQTYYQSLNDDWVHIGVFDRSPIQSQSLASQAPTGTAIRFKFVLVTDNPKRTPKLIAWDLRGAWRPKKRRIINCVVKVNDGLVNRHGTRSHAASEIRDALEEAARKTWVVKLYDFDGAEKDVQFLSATVSNVKMVKDGNPEYTYTLTLQEVGFEDT